jgi:hypothetical protein
MPTNGSEMIDSALSTVEDEIKTKLQDKVINGIWCDPQIHDMVVSELGKEFGRSEGLMGADLVIQELVEAKFWFLKLKNIVKGWANVEISCHWGPKSSFRHNR